MPDVTDTRPADSTGHAGPRSYDSLNLGLRALRVLPAGVPDVRLVGRGDGLAARAHRLDEGRRATAIIPLDARRRRAHRRVSGLHGVRHGVPVGRALRPADRGDARAGRRRVAARAWRPRVPRARLRAVSVSAPAARCSSPLLVAGDELRPARGSPPGRWAVLPPRLRQLATMAPPIDARATRSRRCRRTPPRKGDGARARRRWSRAACSARSSRSVNAATVRVLSAEGCEVVVPRGQGCCGALSLHSGRLDEAQALRARADRALRSATGRRDLDQRRGLRLDAQGVRRAARRRPGLARRARSVRGQGARRQRVPRDARAARAAQAAARCASRITTPATSRTRSASARSRAQLLRAIPGLELLEIPRRRQCCGSAGTYNLVRAGVARTRSASARSTTCRASRPTSSPARIPAARCRCSRSCASAAWRCAPRTRSRCSTPRSAARRLPSRERSTAVRRACVRLAGAAPARRAGARDRMRRRAANAARRRAGRRARAGRVDLGRRPRRRAGRAVGAALARRATGCSTRASRTASGRA